jgi:hypothetical protein
LAKWFDLYDNAIKAEFRGFGIYGNKQAAPEIEAEEFGNALKRIIGGNESFKFQESAKLVRDLCVRAGGKTAAADRVMEVAALGKHLRL